MDTGGDETHESASGGIEVKTKFPVARIKRIMQADEDVGKVAQVTPVAVAKALELFMVSLITRSAGEARTRNSKRVLPGHLKAAVMGDEQFDFLNEIVSKVQDAPVAGQKGLGLEGEEEPEGKKKRGRRKKAESPEF
ncbi:histone-fold-containing protein [Microthyrium microscopicum]|uniref:NCT transcriptional regulatory complex subunit A n=1 Tax=Microthyrium microscopicum TaxID=703497 RepID=A0A6A6UPI5_9PEZI|nr:histone-fold-containing protein [Microthyrium microscopicum]